MSRPVKALIAVVVSLVVLAGVAEWGLRIAIPNVVEREVRSNLDLPHSHPVEVKLGGSALLNALRGGVGDIDVEIVDAPVADGVQATLAFHAERIPFAVTSAEMSDAEASIFVLSGDLDPVISWLTSGAADSGKPHRGDLVVGRTIDAFGFSVPLEATINLSVEDGKVRVVPTGLSAVGFDMSADRLAAATGGLLDPLLSPHLVCVDDRIPAGVTLDKITVAPGGVRVNVSLASDFLSNEAQHELGTCE